MKNAYTVSQVNSYIKSIFARDGLLSSICIKGEISECKYHSSGHIYFTLKDESSQISCIMFSGQRVNLDFELKKGQSIIIYGSINVYESAGKYNVYVKSAELAGAGALYEEIERIKKKLLAEGLFDRKHKKQIPVYIKTLGVVTARTGAAIQDIINICKRRNPYIRIILAPARVQGEGAAKTIIDAAKRLDKQGADVIIIGRGGGSIEDLMAFNDEELARTVFAMKTPVISAVGHETDTTLIDYVSDLRAPTPSAAAELAVYEFAGLEERMVDFHYELVNRLTNAISRERRKLDNFSRLLEYNKPENRIAQKRLELDRIYDRMSERLSGKIRLERDRLDSDREKMKILLERSHKNTIHQLELNREALRRLSPLEKISGGYVYASFNGKALKSASEIKKGDKIEIVLRDGSADCIVEKTKGKDGRD